ncbi:hypothetical protein AQI70_10420 [Streptomyces curacoi]|uniref:Uncharacterized protein n=1 Tax=Streptomyces curacoi TaxID=146536 RepID=A0A124H5D8_9ACTN|nr:hypothetical protein AQI70_10420 [Streptomyces curacoi]
MHLGADDVFLGQHRPVARMRDGPKRSFSPSVLSGSNCLVWGVGSRQEMVLSPVMRLTMAT